MMQAHRYGKINHLKMHWSIIVYMAVRDCAKLCTLFFSIKIKLSHAHDKSREQNTKTVLHSSV